MKPIHKISAQEITNWDESETDYCKAWFGLNWLGGGYVKCGYCQFNAVGFRGYLGDYCCDDCIISLRS